MTDTELEQRTIEIEESATGRLPRQVSVIIPAYDERAHIVPGLEGVRRALESTDWEYEIIVVDDGSADNTA